MLIGILSDTHNQTENLQKALAYFKENNIESLIHCGDMTTVETLQFMCEFEVIYVYGNGDFLTGEMRATLKAYNEKNFAGMQYDGDVDGKRIGVMHGHLYPELHKMIQSGKFDYVFTGHTHRRRDEMVGKTRVINPGALGGTSYQSRSVAILDLKTDQLYFHDID